MKHPAETFLTEVLRCLEISNKAYIQLRCKPFIWRKIENISKRIKNILLLFIHSN